MPNVLGGVGQKVADNLFELGKGVVTGTAKAATDIASETIEQVTSAPSSVTSKVADKSTGETTENKENKKILEKQRFEQVKGELAQFIERKKQLDQRIADEKATERNERENKIIEKRKKDSFTQAMLKKLGAGSHGEMERQKE